MSTYHLMNLGLPGTITGPIAYLTRQAPWLEEETLPLT